MKALCVSSWGVAPDSNPDGSKNVLMSKEHKVPSHTF